MTGVRFSGLESGKPDSGSTEDCVRAVSTLADDGCARAYNLGIGRGFTVREVVTAVERVGGKPAPHRVAGRRQGDPPELVASAAKAGKDLGWTPRYTSLEAIVETAWKWHVKEAGRPG